VPASIRSATNPSGLGLLSSSKKNLLPYSYQPYFSAVVLSEAFLSSSSEIGSSSFSACVFFSSFLSDFLSVELEPDEAEGLPLFESEKLVDKKD